MRILLAEDERTLALRGERDFRAEPVGRGLYADPTMLATQIRRIAAALLAATGILHLALAPEYLHQKTYVGLLFIAGGLTSAAAAAWLWPGTT